MYIYTCRVYLEKLEETNEKVLVLNLIQKKNTSLAHLVQIPQAN